MWISATGLVCPVGLSALEACTAMRAGVSIASEVPYVGNDGELIVGAAVSALSFELPRSERVFSMLCRALVDCIVGGDEIRLESTPLMVLPQTAQVGACPELEGTRVFAALRDNMGWTFDVANSQVFTQGATGTAHAFAEAAKYMQKTGGDNCLIVAADSLLHARTLLKLEQQGRLKTVERSDGVIPGEAAACVLVTRRQKRPYSPQVLGMGFATEVATVLNDVPFRADGLTAAARVALREAGMTMADLDYRISDAAGESYAFREQSLLVTKLLRERKVDFELWHPAEHVGDTGAAAGLVQLAVISDAFRAGYAPGSRVISCCSAASGERTAMILQGTSVSSTEAVQLSTARVAL